MLLEPGADRHCFHPSSSERAATAICQPAQRLVRCQTFLLQNSVDLPGCDWYIDMAHTNMRKRINHSIHNRLGCSNGWRFPDTFGPNWMMGRWCYRAFRFPMGRL